MASASFLEAQLQTYAPNIHPAESKKPNHVQDAKYHLLHALNDIVKLADKIRGRLKDEESLGEFFESVIPGKKPVIWKDMLTLKSVIDSAAAKLGPADRALREAEARKTAREERRAAKTVAVVDTDPKAPAAAAVGAPTAPATTEESSDSEHRPARGRKAVGGAGAAAGGGEGKEEDAEKKTTKKAKKMVAKAPIGKAMREAAWDRWIGADHGRVKCPVCQNRDIRPTDFSAGHILAETCGGATSAENLLPICSTCNVRMATENLHEFCRRIFGREIVLPAAAAAAAAK